MIQARSALVLLILSVACQRESVKSGGAEVRLDPGLNSSVEVVAKDWHRQDGGSQVTVRVANRTAEAVVFHAVGSWATASGQGRGGQSGDYTLPPDGELDVRLATRSADAERLLLELKPGTVPASDLAAAVAASQPAPEPDCNREPTAEQGGPLVGQIGRRPFRPVSTLFVHDERDGSWRFEVVDERIAAEVDLGLWSDRRQSLRLDLPGAPQAGSVFEHAFGPGGGFFQVLSTADSGRTTGWNTANAWRLVIEEWTVVGDDGTGSIGRASGRVEVCYPGSGGIPTASAAGAFRDAAIYVFEAD